MYTLLEDVIVYMLLLFDKPVNVVCIQILSWYLHIDLIMY